jgi:DNA-binding Lrp family transcriptional regulator
MKAKDVPMFKQKVLDMVPITQADMWKKLGIDSREGSNLVSIMLEEHLITRKRQDGRFLLEKANENGDTIDIKIKTEKDLDKELKEKAKEEADKAEKNVVPHDNISKRRTKDLIKQVLEILPITQSEMWKILGITSSAGARLVDTMLEENLITRKKHNNTFILDRVKKYDKKDKVDYTPLLSSKGRFTPCGGCTLECDADICVLLTEWLLE